MLERGLYNYCDSLQPYLQIVTLSGYYLFRSRMKSVTCAILITEYSLTLGAALMHHIFLNIRVIIPFFFCTPYYYFIKCDENLTKIVFNSI